MDTQIRVLITYYVLMLICGLFMRIGIVKIATKAIIEKKLSTGIYRFYPIEGEQAVRLAKGYISGANVVFCFCVVFIPLISVISIFTGTMKL